LQKSLIKNFENNVPRLVTAVITHTEYNIKRLLGVGVQVDRLYYVPNGVDSDRFSGPFKPIEYKFKGKK